MGNRAFEPKPFRFAATEILARDFGVVPQVRQYGSQVIITSEFVIKGCGLPERTFSVQLPVNGNRRAAFEYLNGSAQGDIA